MKVSPRLVFLLTLVVCLGIFLTQSSFAGDDWRSIDPAQLAMKASIVEKDADAEALFWEVRVDDSQQTELSLKHYLRIKIFTERGKESQSKVDIPYLGSTQIKDIAARVIKADGSIVELKKDDVFERTIIKISGAKVKAKSFTLPGVEPGAIIEYRWREVIPGGSANRLKLELETAFGSYSTKYDVKDGQLVFTRKLVQKAATIPADQYATVRSFFEKIRAAEQAPVVLARK